MSPCFCSWCMCACSRSPAPHALKSVLFGIIQPQGRRKNTQGFHLLYETKQLLNLGKINVFYPTVQTGARSWNLSSTIVTLRPVHPCSLEEQSRQEPRLALGRTLGGQVCLEQMPVFLTEHNSSSTSLIL